jgi:hypothetical protein
VVPSALRTLSVVTLLSAVSGTVLLLNTHHGHGSTVASAEANLAGESVTPVAMNSSRIPAPRVETSAYRAQLQTEAAAQVQGFEKVQASAQARVQAATRAKLAAAATRSRLATRQRITRSAVRDPKSVARLMLADRGWGSGQFSCLESLWNRESRWNLHASNPSSGAYGIPQALPGSKMASAGADWRNNPMTQIRWGLNYIADRYGTPCGAWGHSEASGWY